MSSIIVDKINVKLPGFLVCGTGILKFIQGT